MGSRETGEGVENVYAAAQKWVDRALRADDSLFTPGKPIWSSKWLRELRERFLDKPDAPGDNFMQKVEQQLSESSPEVYQLMGEALYFYFLIVSTRDSEAELERIETVLRWSTLPATVPKELIAALVPGLAGVGPAFHTQRHFQLGFLVEFTEQWKGLESNERARLLDEPWSFSDFAKGIKFQSRLLGHIPSDTLPQQSALLHLVFPDTFEGIVSVEHKGLITNAASFAHFITDQTADVDRKIAQVRKGVKAGLGRDFDFYDPSIRSRWDQSQSGPWDTYLRLASEFLDTGLMYEYEIEYKLKAGRELAAARDAVFDGGEWADLVKKGLSGILVFSITQARVRDWIRDSPEEALKALRAIWTHNESSVSGRIRAFAEQLPKTVLKGAGTRMNVASVLLMGIDPERYPPFRTRAFQRAYSRTGYDLPPGEADEAALYEHALGFLDRFIEEARARGIPVRHRLDAQGLVWIVTGLETKAGVRETPPAEDLDALADELHLTVDFLKEIEALLEDKKQVIFQGPPGTGKTYVAQALARHLAGSDERVTLVQLHPSYAYEDFVQGFRPTLEGGQPGFELRDGPLLRAAKLARSEPDAKHFLVVDEINRGAPAKVLGELYFLLEYRDEKIRLQYQRDDEEDFSLPPNLYFIGTMNTADRSIALVDLALRRRFYFVEFHPDDEPVKSVLSKWIEQKAPGMEWVATVVEQANELLEDDRDAAIGPSYFMKDGLDEEKVRRVWRHSVLPYVRARLIGEGDDRLDQFDLDRLRREVGRGDSGSGGAQHGSIAEVVEGTESDTESS